VVRKKAVAAMRSTGLRIEAILFDIDGTLVDSVPVAERTWRTSPADMVWRLRKSCKAATVVETRTPCRCSFRAAPCQLQCKEILEMELSDLVDISALPGAAELLERLPAGRWAAVTSGPRVLMEARLRSAGLPVPEVLITAEDVRGGKPDPECFLLAAAELGVQPADCVVVEDAPAGVAAGCAASAVTLAVTTSHPLAELNEAHAVLTDLTRITVDMADDGLVLRLSSVELC